MFAVAALINHSQGYCEMFVLKSDYMQWNQWDTVRVL